MTPSRLDTDVLRNKLSEISRTLDDLASVGEVPEERLSGDAIVRAAVE